VRVTTLLRRLIGVTGLVVLSFQFDPRGLMIDVRPGWRRPRCGGCGRRRRGYDRAPERVWRHLGLADLKIWLRYGPRRVECSRCGIRTEEVPWAAPGSRFTRDFEEMAAYLAQVTDKTQVTRMLGIAWRTVGAIVERVVKERLDPKRLKGLRRIGVDEFSYRRRHRYLTMVVDHDRRRVVWASPGKGAEALESFFEELGEEGCAALEIATIDMSGGYQSALVEHAPETKVVFDRFHVQRLASDALDEVRREQLQELRGTPAGEELFRSRFALWKNPWNLSREENRKLSVIERTNKTLYRAYLLKETLAKALEYKQPKRAREALRDWLSWASRSRLKPFVKTARTIRQHFEGVVAYVEERVTNGVVEGMNTRLRMVARRAYGFHGPQALVAMLYLCCGGIQLAPRLP
jgi:transposase